MSAFPAHAEIRGEPFGFKSRDVAETFRDQICGTLQRAGHLALRGELCRGERWTFVVFRYLGRAIVWTDGLSFDALKSWLATTQQIMHSMVEAVRPGELVPSVFEDVLARAENAKHRRIIPKRKGPLRGARATLIIMDDLVEADEVTAPWSDEYLALWYGEETSSGGQSRCPEPDAPRKRDQPQTIVQGSLIQGEQS